MIIFKLIISVTLGYSVIVNMFKVGKMKHVSGQDMIEIMTAYFVLLSAIYLIWN